MRLLGAIERCVAALGRVGVVVGLVGGVVSGLGGCGSIEPVAPAAAPITDPAQLYMALTLDHPAVTLSTAPGYTTLQLTATPRDALGQPMVGLPAPTFTSSDTANVQVSADGVLRARGPASGVWVVATVQQGPVSHVDTATITVTTEANPPRLASLSIQPVPPDSAVLFLSGGLISNYVLLYAGSIGALSTDFPLVPQVRDSSGNTVAEYLPFAYTALEPAVARVDHWGGTILARQPGEARFVAQTTAYGISRTDTVAYIVRPPLGVDVVIRTDNGVRGFVPSYGPNEIPSTEFHVLPHGIVLWRTEDSAEVDVTFDDPTNVAQPDAALCNVLTLFGGTCDGGGSMTVPAPTGLFDPTTWRLRQFPVPGVYPFHSARLGVSARIIVGE